MALIVDMENNFSKTPLKNLYLRIDRIQILPKFGFLKAYIEVYVSSGSRDYIRDLEKDQIDYANSMFEAAQSDIIDGDLLNSLQAERTNFSPPPFTREYPISVFHDVYTVKLTEETKNIDRIMEVLYQKIKADPRFTNVRND